MKYYYVGSGQGTTSTKGNKSLYKIFMCKAKVIRSSRRKRIKVLVHLNIWKGLNIVFCFYYETH